MLSVVYDRFFRLLMLYCEHPGGLYFMQRISPNNQYTLQMVWIPVSQLALPSRQWQVDEYLTN